MVCCFFVRAYIMLYVGEDESGAMSEAHIIKRTKLEHGQLMCLLFYIRTAWMLRLSLFLDDRQIKAFAKLCDCVKTSE